MLKIFNKFQLFELKNNKKAIDLVYINELSQ